MDGIYFKINGKKYSVGSELSVDTTLNEYIRRHAGLRGTKYMCLEGGCGACVVHVRAINTSSQELTSFSVNSCLVSILSCDGWDVTTVEGIGNRKIGYNIVQKRLNQYFGSQCGYCSPGFVMSMYSLVQDSGHHLTQEQVENAFGGNLCRCTGYRPILEAFKSLTKNPSDDILNKIKDIEEIDKNICPKSGKKCGGTCDRNIEDWCLIDVKKPTMPKKITLHDGRLWYAVDNIKSIFGVLEENGYDSYMLVAGNTAKGVKPIKKYPKLLIDISKVSELTTHYLDVNLILGGNITLTEAMNIFDELSKKNDDFWYLEIFLNHMQKVAHIPVRNIGTLAGNLMTKNMFPEFQSDIFVLFECVGAIVTIVNQNLDETKISLTDFLTTSMKGRIITQIKLPPLARDYEIVTYKITPRIQNAHAEVNAAFLFKFSENTEYIQQATLVYGGINPMFTHAYKTEKFLVGKHMFNNETLQKALKCLNEEVHADVSPPDPSPYFREKLALRLFYKCIIKLCPRDILDPRYESGRTTTAEDRPPVSRSYQEYDTNQSQYPLTQPLLKAEGINQCAGEAVYSDDEPKIENEVFASFVLSTVNKGDIESIDGSEVLKSGGIAVITSADVPGVNTITRNFFRLLYENEELLASQKVVYYNQPVAIVVANTQVLADQMTSLVKVTYKNIPKKPAVVTIEDAIRAPKEENRLITYPGLVPTDRGTNIQRVIKGKFISPHQYHHMMELHTTISVPVDNAFEIYSSTQWMDLVQSVVAALLKIPEHSVRVRARRCGGGFGCKIGRSNFAVCATALVAKLLNKPCRMSMHMRDIMRVTGKRPNTRLDYEIGVDNRGEIQYMDGAFYVNDGISSNENENAYATSSLENCYDTRRWKVESFGVITDTPTNAFMRAPGGFEGISGIEHIMDHIAEELKIDPIQVRLTNYRREDNDLPVLVPMFMEKIEYEKRKKKVQEFNACNRWKKRGLKLSNMAFPAPYLGNYNALVSVYHGDGSVIINVGGIELGQGLFTRLMQTAANELKIPVEKVAVLPSVNFASPNNMCTASSITSPSSMYSVIRSCDQINARLAPIRAEMPQATWEEIVEEADRRGILLQANYQSSEFDPRMIPYSIFGIASTEVEIDVLTGTKWMVRADLLVDAGRSVNPAIDIAQIEGAFVQGLSLWLMEDAKYNNYTGEIYTDRTWNYKIIGAKDIPHDYRVYLRRNTVNPVGILGSKGVGEPAITLAHVVVNSLREAIQASRCDSGYDTSKFLFVDVPVTNENVVNAADVKIEEFLLYDRVNDDKIKTVPKNKT